MFQFEHPEFLWAFLILPVLVAFFVAMRLYQKRALKRFGEEGLLARLMPEFSKNKHTVKFIILMIASAFLIIAWANPQWGTKKQKVKRQSVDVYIALDISKSMLAEDVQPSRLERSKRFVGELVDALKGNRIGNIIFAGHAYLQMPLTDDYSAAKMMVQSSTTEMAPTQGTAIGEAIQLVMKSFERDDKHQKALIVISDGEDHEEKAMELASEAKASGVFVYTVGVGTEYGGTIPENRNGLKQSKRDKDGNVVVTKLNQGMLRDVAKAGGGNYFNLKTDKNIVSALNQRIEQLEKREFEHQRFDEYNSYFQYFLFFGILLIVLEFLLDFRKSRLWVNRRDIFKV